MPYFLNSITPVNQFTKTTKEKYFVDKSELIEKMNELVSTASQYVCITRPRRFGKTINAMMLACYYSKNADFKKLFDNLEISKSESYLEHLNKRNLVYITFSKPTSDYTNYMEYIGSFIKQLTEDLKDQFDIEIDKKEKLGKTFEDLYNETGQGFIFIIDEWDYIFNNNLFSENDRKEFLRFLEDLLKYRPYVELAYMTGVLPIAKYSQGSVINMFREYNILNDKIYYNYFGFTLEETKKLCAKQNEVNFDKLKEWYDGYKTYAGADVFNPRSVVCALSDGVCQSYWTNTGSMDEILYYINSDIDSVKNDIIQMTSGIPVEIKLKGYGAKQIELNNRNQILSAMKIY